MIEFRRVSKVYHTGTHALKDVSFKIMDGEFLFIIGRSGAGKSTLIKLLTCEEKPSEGSVLIDDFDISRIRRSLVPYLRRNIGMIFQDFRLIYTKTVYENVAFAMEIIGASRRSIQRRVPIVLSIVGLKDKANDRPGELSGGEQQRVSVARAMVNNPMLILADEPTGNLDPVNSESVMALLEEINRSGTTVIICTHDHDLVDRMKKRVVEISDGILVRDDCEGAYANCVPVLAEYIEKAELENEFGQTYEPQRTSAQEDYHEDDISGSSVDEVADITDNLHDYADEDQMGVSSSHKQEQKTEEADVFDGEFQSGLKSQREIIEMIPVYSEPDITVDLPEPENIIAQKLDDLSEEAVTKRFSREERLARALRKYREQGHEIFLPGTGLDDSDVDSEEPAVPDKDDLLGLSESNADEAIS